MGDFGVIKSVIVADSEAVNIGKICFEYGAMSSKYRLYAENKYTAYAAMCVCISEWRHLLLHYISLKPLLKMIHGLIHWALLPIGLMRYMAVKVSLINTLFRI